MEAATTEIYALSLHDALPISRRCRSGRSARRCSCCRRCTRTTEAEPPAERRRAAARDESWSSAAYTPVLRKTNTGRCGASGGGGHRLRRQVAPSRLVSEQRAQQPVVQRVARPVGNEASVQARPGQGEVADGV